MFLDPELSDHDIIYKNAIFWDVTPCSSCENRQFGGTCRLHRQGEKNKRA
jgi:hypothetical protein